jgi:hypothetical protein
MALFWGQPCPLCDINMGSEEGLFGTSHFLGRESDLYGFSDAVMHWDCYARWSHRPRFARLYFEAKKGWSAGNRYWLVAYEDDDIHVSANPDPLVNQVEIVLAETGSTLRIDIPDWNDWLQDDWAETCNHPIERESLATLIPRLRAILPDESVFVTADEIESEDRLPLTNAGGMVARVGHELACRRLARRALSKGIACPRCGVHTTAFDYFEVESVSEDGPQSHLRCQAFDGRFGPLDMP